MVKKAYFSSPAPVQKLVLNVLPEQRPLQKHVREFGKNQWLPLEQLQELQCQKLQRIIHHAYQNVPYYKRIFDERGLLPDDVRRLEDLQNCPY